MTNPDVTPYIDLILSDKDPQDIFDAAIEVLKVRMPEWVPREGNTEVLLLEALALEVSELIFALNRIPNAVVQVFLSLVGVTRDAGAPPTVDLTFNMSGTSGYTVPAGVSVRLDLTGGLEPITFTTEEELIIEPGVTTGIVSATGDRFTVEGNGTPAASYVELLDSVIYVDSVETASIVTGGRNAEDDAAYFERGIQRLARLTDTLVLPQHFESAALEEVYVKRVFALDNYNPANDANNNGPVGNDGGHITVAVYGDDAPLSVDDKAALEAKLEASAAANLDVHVIDPTITPVNITVQVKRFPNQSADAVEAAVVAALESYLSPTEWAWAATVRKNELIQTISNVAGVDYVDILSVPAGDTNLAGVAPLADAGVIAVTVI